MDQSNHHINLEPNNEDPTSWMNQEMLDIVWVFSIKGGLDRAYTEVGSFSSWGVFSLEEDKRICIIYDGWFLPLHEWLFFHIGLWLYFNDFKVGKGILNHTGISFCKCIKWVRPTSKSSNTCEYKMSVPTLKLFFYLFNIQQLGQIKIGQGSLSLRLGTKMFEANIHNMKNVKDRYYLVMSFT